MSHNPDTPIIQAPCVITLTWTLRDSLNTVISKQETPIAYFYGGNDLLPKIEEALRDHQKGDQLDLYLEPEHAYGEYDSSLVFFEPRSIFPEPLEAGMQFEGLPTGAKSTAAPENIIYTVTEVYDEYVVIDGNHPLSGISLKLHINIREVRMATPEEIEQGTLVSMDFEVADLLPLGKKLH